MVENVQRKFEELFKHSCYVFCLCYKFSNTKNEWKWLEYIAKGVQLGYITEDCFVAKPVEFINECILDGKCAVRDVEKPDFSIHALEDKNNIVMFQYNGGTHFVIMNQAGDIIFDPSGNSNSAKFGIPVSIRRFVFNKPYSMKNFE